MGRYEEEGTSAKPRDHCGSVTDVLKPLIGPWSDKRPPQHHSDRAVLLMNWQTYWVHSDGQLPGERETLYS